MRMLEANQGLKVYEDSSGRWRVRRQRKRRKKRTDRLKKSKRDGSRENCERGLERREEGARAGGRGAGKGAGEEEKEAPESDRCSGRGQTEQQRGVGVPRPAPFILTGFGYNRLRSSSCRPRSLSQGPACSAGCNV